MTAPDAVGTSPGRWEARKSNTSQKDAHQPGLRRDRRPRQPLPSQGAAERRAQLASLRAERMLSPVRICFLLGGDRVLSVRGTTAGCLRPASLGTAATLAAAAAALQLVSVDTRWTPNDCLTILCTV